jgi:hypothetical protein
LLHEVNLEQGEIQEPCMWARASGRNVLISVLSPAYLAAQELTQIQKDRATWRNAKPGDVVTLKGGERGRYLGKMHMVRHRYSSSPDTVLGQYFADPSGPVHAILDERDANSSMLILQSSAKLARIEQGEALDPQVRENLANEITGTPGYGRLKYSGYERPAAVTVDPISSVELVMEEDPGCTTNRILIDASGNHGYVSGRRWYGNKMPLVDASTPELRYKTNWTVRYGRQETEITVIDMDEGACRVLRLDMIVTTTQGRQLRMPLVH